MDGIYTRTHLQRTIEQTDTTPRFERVVAIYVMVYCVILMFDSPRLRAGDSSILIFVIDYSEVPSPPSPVPHTHAPPVIHP